MVFAVCAESLVECPSGGLGVINCARQGYPLGNEIEFVKLFNSSSLESILYAESRPTGKRQGSLADTPLRRPCSNAPDCTDARDHKCDQNREEGDDQRLKLVHLSWPLWTSEYQGHSTPCFQ